MAGLGRNYGSEWHLLAYRKFDPASFDCAILEATRANAGEALRWLYPDRSGRRGREFQGVSFVGSDTWARGSAKAAAAWREFWPQRGTAPSWDGLAILTRAAQPERWLLLEAKANHPEFVGAPCRAAGSSLKKIQNALNRTKAFLDIHRHFDWTGSYYQFANRLALTVLLNRHGVPASLVEVFFTSDRFPDGRGCPASRDEWQPLIEARRQTLGFPQADLEHVFHVFIDAYRPN